MNQKLPHKQVVQRRHSWQVIIFGILVFAVLIVVLFRFGELEDIGQALRGSQWYWLLLALILNLAGYFVGGLSYRLMLPVPVNLWQLIRINFKVYFLGAVLPILGLPAFSYFTLAFKRFSVRPGAASFTYLTLMFLFYASFAFILLPYALIQASVTGTDLDSERTTIIIAIILFTVLAGLIILMASHQNWLKKIIITLTRFVNKVLALLSGRRKNTVPLKKISATIKDFYSGWRLLRQRPGRLVQTFFLTLLDHTLDVGTLFILLINFGANLPLSSVIIAYAITQFISRILVTPGRLAVFEATLSVLLVSLGAPLAPALFAVLLYRVLTFWLVLPVGLYLFRPRQ